MAMKSPRYYDIALNLTDPMFRGIYHGTVKHEPDIANVLYRAHRANCTHLLLTGSSLTESSYAKELAHKYHDSFDNSMKLYYTIGVHPCCVNEFATDTNLTIDRGGKTDKEYNETLFQNIKDDDTIAQKKLENLYDLIEANVQDRQFRAVGEIGLDYDRLHYSCKDMQKKFFYEQLKLACKIDEKYSKNYPLFLHMRSSCDDFIEIMNKFITGFHESSTFYKFSQDKKYVVHSFTGDKTELDKILHLSRTNCYVGINGASLRTEEHIANIKRLPLERILIETDAPWCIIKKNDASYKYLAKKDDDYNTIKKEKLSKLDPKLWNEHMIKGRNEPCNVVQVAEIISQIKGIPLDEVVDTIWENSCSVYGA